MKEAINATSSPPITPIRQAETAPTDVSYSGPVITRKAGFAAIPAARLCRATSSGYRLWIAEMVLAAEMTTARIQAARAIRSRRRLSRTSRP